MNDENKNEPVKLKYVNPLTLEEIGEKEVITSDSDNIENTDNNLNDTNNIDNLENTTNVENDIYNKENIVDEAVTTISINKNNKKIKLVAIIVILIILLIILASAMIAPKLLKKDVENNPQPEEPKDTTVSKIEINDIISNIQSSIPYKTLQRDYTVNVENTNDTIKFTLTTGSMIKEILFNINDKVIETTIPKLENNDNLLAFYSVMDSIGRFYSHDVNEVYNYLELVKNNFNFENTNITTMETDKDYIIRFNIEDNIDTKSMNDTYFTLTDLNNNKNLILTNTSDLKKGDLVLFTNSDLTYTVLLGERNNLTSRTYNSILSVIELLFPEEINDFKSKFPNLSSIAFDKYRITLDPKLDPSIYPEYREDYKFILIEMTK